jgi:hypothetical protein
MRDTPEALICHLGEGRGSFAGHQLRRTILLNIHKQQHVKGVYCNDVAVPAVPATGSLVGADSGWWWNAGKQILTIKLKQTTYARVIKIS